MTSMKGRLALLRADVRGRVRRSGAQRAEILAAFDQSGVSAAEFARLVGVKYPTLAGWLHRRGRPGKAPAVRFVEAAVPTPEAPTPVELELPGGVRRNRPRCRWWWRCSGGWRHAELCRQPEGVRGGGPV